MLYWMNWQGRFGLPVMELNMPEMWSFAWKMRRIGVKVAFSSISDLSKLICLTQACEL